MIVLRNPNAKAMISRTTLVDRDGAPKLRVHSFRGTCDVNGPTGPLPRLMVAGNYGNSEHSHIEDYEQDPANPTDYERELHVLFRLG